MITKTAALVGVVNSAIALLVAFGIDVTAEQSAAIIAVANALMLAAAAYLDPEVPWFGITEG